MGLIAGTFIGLAIGMLLFHLVIRRQYKRQFSKLRRSYRHQMAQQEEEIRFRQRHLNNYRFLEYNLSEVLVVQPQIILP